MQLKCIKYCCFPSVFRRVHLIKCLDELPSYLTYRSPWWLRYNPLLSLTGSPGHEYPYSKRRPSFKLKERIEIKISNRLFLFIKDLKRSSGESCDKGDNHGGVLRVLWSDRGVAMRKTNCCQFSTNCLGHSIYERCSY